MNIKAIVLLSTIAVSALITPAFSQENIDLSKLRVFDSSDWRKPSYIEQGYGSLNTPVLVKDEFDGSKNIAVFTKNIRSDYDGTLVINWSSKSIGIYSYVPSMEDWMTGVVSISAKNQPDTVTILIGGKTFELEGKRGNFKVTQELAYALKTAPAEKITLKLEFADSNAPVLAYVVNHTIESLKIVYRDAKSPS